MGFLEKMRKSFRSGDVRMTEEMIKSISLACDSIYSNSIKDLLHRGICYKFFEQHIPQYFATLTRYKYTMHDDVVEHIFYILKKLNFHFPTKSTQIVGNILMQIELNFIPDYELKGTKWVSQQLKLMREIWQETIKEFHSGTPMRDQIRCNATAIDLNDDLTLISVMPTSEDIFPDSKREVRVNQIYEEYSNMKNYLDVQFKLLKEDLVRPIREALVNMTDNTKDNLTKPFCKVYKNVRIVSPQFHFKQFVFKITIGVKNLQNIRWESNKRLKYGSLVCLSDDGFQTALFATIAERKVHKLKRGEICLQFDHNICLDEILTCNKTFEMVESPAYFEAYKHVLQALQNIDLDTEFPFEKYLLNTQERHIFPPKYITKSPIFDFSSIIYEEDFTSCYQEGDSASECKNTHNIEKSVNQILNDVEEPVNAIKRTTRRESSCTMSTDDALGKNEINVLNSDLWPTPAALKLDESQYNALKTAITKEFAIIQGPPGTGKTFIGVKIVQLLLANQKSWNQCTPILIVCYTNHALDQFLQAIIDIHRMEMWRRDVNIVRLGSRLSKGSSDTLKACCLEEIRKEYRKVGGTYYNSNISKNDIFETMFELQNSIAEKYACIASARTKLLTEKELENGKCVTNYVQFRKLVDQKQYFSTPAVVEWLNDTSKLNSCESMSSVTDNAFEEEASSGYDGAFKAFKDEFNIYYTIGGRRRRRTRKVQKCLKYQEIKASVQLEKFVTYNSSQLLEYDLEHIEKVHCQFKEQMTESEASEVQNVWKLSGKDRWRLYNYWTSMYIKNKAQEMQLLLEQYDIELKKLKEIESETTYGILKCVNIIGMTTTCSARYTKLLQRLQPRIMIVEEASEVLEAHIIASISKGCEHLIMIGDHKQLRPKPTDYDLEKNYYLGISLFERMVLNKVHCDSLEIQHRMRPEIAELITPSIYKSLKNDKSVLDYSDIEGILGNMFFITHDEDEDNADDTRSHSNQHEATFIASLCRYLLDLGYESKQITVLTTYTGQLLLLKRNMSSLAFDGVKITVVDDYQGEENDIILLSLVRSNKSNSIGFLNIPNRVCVALSRARKGLYIIGNGDMLSGNSTTWTKILNTLRNKKAFTDSLPLACHKHPQNIVHAKSHTDFAKVPSGGCNMPCEQRLNCGHVCEKKCHPFDSQHVKYKCLKPCVKKCDNFGHPCKKRCSDDCGECQVLVAKKLTKCGHTANIPCFIDQSDYKCNRKCERQCPNNHQCPKECFENCGNCLQIVMKTITKCGHTDEVPCYVPENYHECKILVERSLPKCEHVQKVFCHLPLDKILCKNPCNRKCINGHLCSKTCGESCGECRYKIKQTLECKHILEVQCSASLASMKCIEKCNFKQPCGHVCKKNCSECWPIAKKGHPQCPDRCGKALPLCTLGCQNQCGHEGSCSSSCNHTCTRSCHGLICSHPCREPCLPCRSPCAWSCKHKKCELKCWEPCTRQPCNERCTEKLGCGHNCVGLCGEKCPQKCLECESPKDVSEKQKRYLQLEPCGDMISVDEMDEWVQKSNRQLYPHLIDATTFLKCPKCYSIVKTCPRYNSILKQQENLLSKAKERMLDSIALKKQMRSWMRETNTDIQIFRAGAHGSAGKRLVFGTFYLCSYIQNKFLPDNEQVYLSEVSPNMHIDDDILEMSNAKVAVEIVRCYIMFLQAETNRIQENLKNYTACRFKALNWCKETLISSEKLLMKTKSSRDYKEIWYSINRVSEKLCNIFFPQERNGILNYVQHLNQIFDLEIIEDGVQNYWIFCSKGKNNFNLSF